VDEFLDFIRIQKEEAIARIKDITEHPVMVPQEMQGSGKKYYPPTEGTVYLHVAGMN
jgi:hypothetical protein